MEETEKIIGIDFETFFKFIWQVLLQGKEIPWRSWSLDYNMRVDLLKTVLVCGNSIVMLALGVDWVLIY